MVKILQPYQCLGISGDLLVAARASSIDLIGIKDAVLLSTWSCPRPQCKLKGNLPTRISRERSQESPPQKKRKLLVSDTGGEISQVLNGKQHIRSEAATSGLEAPAVTVLTPTTDGKHVVAVTGDDKSIRVFEVMDTDGVPKLQQLSCRPMPKRPCALAITHDNLSILSADKFGDVYSLPLLYSEPAEGSKSATTPPELIPRPLVPAANELTIHSQRNKKALANQRKQINQASEKAQPAFDHKLLLGHVSLLTDIKIAVLHGRSYIITSDRDEHIRVSRGIPHAHVIESFCLGHSEFISRLCIPATRPNIMISGGGEDFLFVWNWKSGSILSKANLMVHAAAVMRNLNATVYSGTSAVQPKLAVSGICHIHEVVDNQPLDLIVVSCEGLPALFAFALSMRNELQYTETVYTSGNILSMSAAADQGSLVVSVDNIHKPGSKVEPRTSEDSNVTVLHMFNYRGKVLLDSSLVVRIPEILLADMHDVPVNLASIMYTEEGLRKRRDDTMTE